MSFTDSNHFSMSLSFSYWNITELHSVLSPWRLVSILSVTPTWHDSMP